LPAITLLLKAHNDAQLRQIDKSLKETLEGLRIKIEPCQTTSRNWVQTVISGEDETIAQNYLAREIGICPKSFDSISKFSTLKGRISELTNSEEMDVDIGLSLEFASAKVSTSRLQAQLVDGRKIALRKIAELFGFSRNLPMTIKILNVDREGKRLEAELAANQLRQYEEWVKSMLDRLIILGVPLGDVESALRKENLERDIVNIEALGLLEHAVTCKLGTDAIGLIPKIGRRMQNAALTVIVPKKILNFLGQNSNLFAS
jgi:hypothetical protein